MALPPPRFMGRIHVDLQRRIPPRMPDLGVLELSNPRVFGKHGWVFSEDGVLLPEHSWHGQDVGRMALPGSLPGGARLPGTTLSLASDFCHRSYGHYLLDSLPRMHLFLSAGFTLDDADHVLCHRPPTAEAARHFARLEVPPKNVSGWESGRPGIRNGSWFPRFPAPRRTIPTGCPAT